MKIRVVTDSTADLPKEIAESLGITVVPAYVQFGDETYKDGIDLTPEEFYQRLTNSSVRPTTAATSIGDFEKVYRDLAEEADAMISIHISQELSGICNSAEQAAKIVTKEQERCKIVVIDSSFAAMAMGLVVMFAARLAADKRLEEIIDAAKEKIQHHIGFLVILDTLDYIEQGGRANAFVRAAKKAMGILKVKPMLTIKEGKVSLCGFLRAHKEREVIKFLKRFSGITEIALEYSTNEKEVREIGERVESIYPDTPLYFSHVTPVLGTHAGPGALAVSVITE